MDLLTNGLVTAGATLVATFPAVYFGIRLERRHAQEQREREEQALSEQRLKERRQAQLHLIGSGILHEARDWAQALREALNEGKPLGVTPFVTSGASLRQAADSDALPVESRAALLRLANRIERLEIAVRPHIATQLPPYDLANGSNALPAGQHEFRDFLLYEAVWAGEASRVLIGATESQIKREGTTRRSADINEQEWNLDNI